MVRPVDTRNSNGLRLANNGGLVRVATATGPAGPNTVPTDAAIAAAVGNPASDTAAALSATYAVVRNVAPGASIAAAITASAAGDIVVVRPGAHAATTLTVDKAIELRIESGATITQTASTTGNLIDVTAQGASVVGAGTLDGNKANQSASNKGINIAADDVTVRGLTVVDVKQYGVYGAGRNGTTIDRVKVTDSGSIGIFVEPAAAAFDGLRITDCDVDRSSIAAASIVEGGIKVRGSATYAATNVLVRGNHVKMPVSPTDGTAIGIEVWYANGARTIGNETTGGAMGLSIAACDRSVTNANSVHDADTYGIELAGCRRSTCSGNTVSGNSNTGKGIVTAVGNSVYSDGTAITGNVIQACTAAGIENNNAIDINVSGNSLYGGTGYHISLLSTVGASVTGNTLDGNSTATKGIVLNASYRAAVNGNLIRNFTQHGLLLFGSSAVTMNLITIDGNSLHNTNVPLGTSLSGGAALGTRVTARGNAWEWSGATILDWADYLNDVRECVGTGSPEAVVTAGVGSIFHRRDGGASTCLYVKESGTGNTGWVAK